MQSGECIFPEGVPPGCTSVQTVSLPFCSGKGVRFETEWLLRH